MKMPHLRWVVRQVQGNKPKRKGGSIPLEPACRKDCIESLYLKTRFGSSRLVTFSSISTDASLISGSLV
jgi:hypothetical protein